MKESVLRTIVPIIYALIIKSGVGAWLGLNDAFLQSLAAAIGAGLIYVLLRFLERKKSAFGWLLGYASQPVYPDPPKKGSEDGFLDPFVWSLQVTLVSALLIAPLIGAAWAISIMVASLAGAVGFHRMRQHLRPPRLEQIRR